MLALLRAFGLCLLESARFAALIDIRSHGTWSRRIIERRSSGTRGAECDASQKHPFHCASHLTPVRVVVADPDTTKYATARSTLQVLAGPL